IIDKAYRPYSIRFAASTKVVELGISTAKVQDHDNSSQDANIFERYHNKPCIPQHSNTTIRNSPFFF
ncbi:MAG: hypothetical protein EXX96DRAFT_454209, partial [Benjaminiella poitrasii]